MTKKFLTPIDLTKNELQNAIAQVLGTAPSSPAEGQFYYDSVTGAFTWRNGTTWINPLDRANHTGTQTAASISNLATVVKAYRLDEFAVPTADIAMNSRKITGLASGTNPADAVTFAQLQAVAQGRDFKDSVRVATTAAGTLASSFENGDSVDGVTLATGDRILLKNQADPAENGIYTVNASGAPTRATDADDGTKLTAGASVLVEEGTANADTQWTLTTNGAITVGTTGLTFAQTGSGTTYTEGTGIDISGSVIAIDTSVVPRKVAADIGDGSTTSIAVTHSLGTRDVLVEVYRNSSPYDTVEVEVRRNSTSQVTLIFAVAPTTNEYRVVVHG